MNMLIGALIGLGISLIMTWIYMINAQMKADRHNNALGGRLARLTGKAHVTIHYGPIVIKAVTFTVIGAIVGHFI